MRNKCNLSKLMQNVIVLNEANYVAYDVSSQYGNMCLNRFCIDEDAAFELSGVNYLTKSSNDIKYGHNLKFKAQREEKGRRIHSGDRTLFC